MALSGLSRKLAAKGVNERIDVEKSGHWWIPSETRGGSPSSVAMGGVRPIQAVIAEKGGHWWIPSVLSGNKWISRENWRISAALSGLIW